MGKIVTKCFKRYWR